MLTKGYKLLCAALATAALSCHAQTKGSSPNVIVPTEDVTPGANVGASRIANNPALPKGWSLEGNFPGGLYEFGTSDKSRDLPTPARQGQHSAYICARPGHVPRADSNAIFTTLMQSISAEAYHDKRMRLSVMLGTNSVAGEAGIWMKIENRGGKAVAFENTQTHPSVGDTHWKREEIVLDVPADAADISFGFLLAGNRGCTYATDIVFGETSRDTPITSSAPPPTKGPDLPKAPVNLDFTDD